MSFHLFKARSNQPTILHRSLGRAALLAGNPRLTLGYGKVSPPIQPETTRSTGKGDNASVVSRQIFKPTGLIDRPAKRTISLPRVEVEAPITPKLDGFPPQVVDMTVRQFDGITDDGLRIISARQMSNMEMIAEIRGLLEKQARTDEEEALLIIFMEAL